MAKAAVEMSGIEVALATMERSLDWSTCLADQELTALMLSQKALILFRGGRLEEAEQTFADALDLMREGDRDAIRVLLNRGALFVEMGVIGRARLDLATAVQLSRPLGDTQFQHIALHNLGCLEFTSGDLPTALRLMQEALEVDSQTLEGLTHLDRSRVLLAAGLPDEADAALAQAGELFRRDRCWQDLAEVDLTRAEVALLTGRVAEARLLAGRARDRFRRHGNDRWRRNAELVLLHADQAAGRPPARLLPPTRRLAAEFAAADFGQQARSTLLLAAELELERHQTDAADILLDQIGTVGRTEPIAVRLHHRLVRAVSLERHDRLPAARRSLAQGLRELAAYQAQFGGIDLQSASAIHGRRLVEHDVDLAIRSGRAVAVLAAVERSRAVTSRIQPVTPPADEATAGLLTALRRAAETAADDVQAGARPLSATGTRRAPASPALRQVADLQAQLRTRSWLNSGSRAWQPPAPVRDLRAAAATDGCHLVTVIEHRGHIGSVTITEGGRMRLRELADAETVRGWQRRLAADLDVLANAGLPEAMKAAVRRSLRHSAAELGRLLGPAIVDDDRPVVLSSPGSLLTLPWSLLPPLAGRPLTVAPSLSGWLRGRTRLAGAAPADRWSMTAVAGPGLARAQEEAADVAASWSAGADVRQLPGATPAELLEAMATSRLVHVAAHGVHRSENPMFSSLSLTSGPLFAYELDQRPQLPEHVVLSACDAGQSTVRATETLGLTSVLLQLGTASVVAGVARVHDDTAAKIMTGYHRHLVRGANAAEALCAAAAGVEEPSPFVCFGTAWRA
ncbi:CHAT domain-containing protein [Microlunatus phosphovorus]|nr:CHAT domain-containing tetratricopeptide repeat protein [Microlunatus phosphovorus]